MKISVLCVGKVKERFWNEAIDEYRKRLSRYCTLNIVQLPDEATPENASEQMERQIREKEGSRILAWISKNAGSPGSSCVLALAIKGKKMDSPALASFLQGRMTSGAGHLIFVIGGSLGLSEGVLNRADEELSFSDLTFPHQLMRVILLEQIYRSFRILNHEPYHK